MRRAHSQHHAGRLRTAVLIAALTLIAASVLWLIVSVPTPPAPSIRKPSPKSRTAIAPIASAPTTAPSTPAPRIVRQPATQPSAPPATPRATLPTPDLTRSLALDPAALLAAPPPPPRTDRSAEFRAARVKQFGGTPRTEDAVEAGLDWLAAHQQPDGAWSRTQFSRMCPPGDRCPGAAVDRTAVSLQAGITGLATLAFLGAGYTDRPCRYQNTVARAIAALLRMQQPHGGFSADERNAGYNDAVATFALAEYYALTGEPRAAVALRRAVGRLVASQQPLGGWDYLPRPSTGRDDSSITAWMVQALQACAAAGIDVPPQTLVLASMHFARASEQDGRVWYADADVGFEVSQDTFEPKYRYGPAMTAAGLLCQSLLGMRENSPLAALQQAILLSDLPSAARMQRDRSSEHSYYYWYYGTVAMFQIGGDGWDRWNAHLRDAILPMQDRSELTRDARRHRYGSWPPFGAGWGKWGRRGGRVYSTALCVLTLETYYRHAPAYLDAYRPLTSAKWRAALKDMDPLARRWSIKALADMRLEIAEPVLVALLDDEVNDNAVRAAIALVGMNSPAGLDVLAKAVTDGDASAEARFGHALRKARRLHDLPPAKGVVRVFDAQRRLGTVELDRSYVNMPLRISRGDHDVCSMRVIRRYTDSNVVVAEMTEPGGGDPQPGDSAISTE